jgi:hypothetical protein
VFIVGGVDGVALEKGALEKGALEKGALKDSALMDGIGRSGPHQETSAFMRVQR